MVARGGRRSENRQREDLLGGDTEPALLIIRSPRRSRITAFVGSSGLASIARRRWYACHRDHGVGRRLRPPTTAAWLG